MAKFTHSITQSFHFLCVIFQLSPEVPFPGANDHLQSQVFSITSFSFIVYVGRDLNQMYHRDEEIILLSLPTNTW